MKVLITGGSGDVGEFVVSEVKKKHEVVIADMKPPKINTDVKYVEVDLECSKAADDVVKGMDVVIHLAAIPHPFNHTGEVVMRVNMVSAYNVAEACKKHKVKRVIYGGSDSSTGFGIRETLYKPLYLPMDADHPCWPHESYSLTKHFGEVIFREYARAFKIPTVSVRFQWVMLTRDRAGAEGVVNKTDEKAFSWLGGYVMPQDVANIVALTIDYDMGDMGDFPFEMFYAHAKDNYNSHFHNTTTLEDAKRMWGEVPEVRNPEYYEKNPYAPFYDMTNVYEKLGYTPQYTFKDFK